MPPPPDPNNPIVFPEPAVPVTLPAVEPGTKVLAFYHANHHPQGFRYVRVCHNVNVTPLLGLSSGWLCATVLSPWGLQMARRRGAQEAMYVHVRFDGVFHDTLAGRSDGLDMHVHAGLVQIIRSDQQLPAVLLSVLVVRWWDYFSNTTWSDYSVTNDGFHRDLIDGKCGMYPSLAGEFEMYTVFVKCTADLDKISEHWAQAALQGLNTVAWYFLWPHQVLVADRTGGSVREQKLFALCQRMERAGIRSGWPHPSHLYRQLCGKLWIPQMSLNREYRVPPTTRVQYADVRCDVEQAAEQAIRSLLDIRREVWGKPALPVDEFKGVVKLGFSWQGDDVLPFQGKDNLTRVLLKLLEQHHSEQLFCLVQEMVPDVVCEFRVVCFNDAAGVGKCYKHEWLWMKMKEKGKHHNHQSVCEVKDFALTSAHVLSDDEAADEFFDGDRQTLAQARLAAEMLVKRWMLWFLADCGDPVPVTRLDFLISRHGGEGGGPAAWTCEVGECGASLCSIECDARNCATLNWTVRLDPSGRFPMTLPTIRRNNGWKS